MTLVKAVIRDWGVHKDALVLKTAEQSTKIFWKGIIVTFLHNGKTVTLDNPIPFKDGKNRGYYYTPCEGEIKIRIKSKTAIYLKVGSSRLQYGENSHTLILAAIAEKDEKRKADAISTGEDDENEEEKDDVVSEGEIKRPRTDRLVESVSGKKNEQLASLHPKAGAGTPLPQFLQNLIEQYRKDVVMYTNIATLREGPEKEMLDKAMKQVMDMQLRQEYTTRIDCYNPVLASKILPRLELGKYGKVENDQIVINGLV
jgi:hypothetical protein